MVRVALWVVVVIGLPACIHSLRPIAQPSTHLPTTGIAISMNSLAPDTESVKPSTRNAIMENMTTGFAAPQDGSQITALAARRELDAASPPLGSGDPVPTGKLFPVLVAVISSPHHVRARDAIRATWGREAQRAGYFVRFFIGELPPPAELPINDTVNRTEAILQQDREYSAEEGVVRLSGFTESYHNLTAKALGVMEWAHANMYRAVFKVDDDTFVRVEMLSEFVRSHNPASLLSAYGGQFVPSHAAATDPASKWYMLDQYPATVWPTYANGPGVFLGPDLVHYLAEHHSTLPQYRVDDVALGIWFADRTSDPGVGEGVGVPHVRVGMMADCYSWQLHDNAVWVNPVTPSEMYRLNKGQRNSEFVLSGCLTTHLCEGGPDIPDWDAFAAQPYKDNGERA